MSAPTRWEGGCLCGAVRFEARAFETDAAHCHCSMCRKFHGTGFATFASVPRESFRWTRGAEEIAAYRAPNGTTRRFCRRCGSSLSFEASRPQGAVEIALGCFDDDVPVRPDAHIFVASGVAWARPGDDDALPCFSDGRDGPRFDEDR